jgi:hypothetical protein
MQYDFGDRSRILPSDIQSEKQVPASGLSNCPTNYAEMRHKLRR